MMGRNYWNLLHKSARVSSCLSSLETADIYLVCDGDDII